MCEETREKAPARRPVVTRDDMFDDGVAAMAITVPPSAQADGRPQAPQARFQPPALPGIARVGRGH